jgi:phenylacetate-CoA ligase
MDYYQPIVKNLVYPLYQWKDGSYRQLKHLREMEGIQFLPRQELMELQLQRLKSILTHAYATCPFYKARFEQAGFDPAKIRSESDLERIPVLTKTDVQENMESMISGAYRKESLIRDKSGGSSGNPVVFYYQRDRLDSRHAATLRHNRWAGWEIGDKVGLIWGAYSDLIGYKKWKTRLRNTLLNRFLVLDTSAMTEGRIASYTQELRKYRPKILLAYTNSLVLLARYLKDQDIQDIRPAGIVCTCEVLTPESRSLIESVFGTKVFDRYGSREVSVIASECDRHEGMHINADNLYLEFTKDGKNVPPGEVGEILVTDLRNDGMPLIRYKIEDMGALSSGSCSCGRGLPLMQMMAGRVTDFIVTPEGKIVSGVALATYMITNIDGVGQVQLIQDTMNELRVKLVRNSRCNDTTTNSLVSNAKKFLGNSMRIEIDFVDSIPRGPSGKLLFSISKVNPSYFIRSEP